MNNMAISNLISILGTSIIIGILLGSMISFMLIDDSKMSSSNSNTIQIEQEWNTQGQTAAPKEWKK